MKTETKLKILKWVAKLIRLDWNSTPYVPNYIIEQRKIQKITSQYVLSKEQEETVKHYGGMEVMFRDWVVKGISNQMLQIGAIKFETFVREDGQIGLKGTTYVPEKL